MAITYAFDNLNWLAILTVWIMHIVLSLLWYQPFVFGNAWVRFSGKRMEPSKKWIPAGILSHFICIYALAVIINLANATTLLEGAFAGVLFSICFIGAMLGGELVWEKIPFRLFLIRLGDQVVTLGIAGALLAIWRLK